MPSASRIDYEPFIGRAPAGLSLDGRAALVAKYIAQPTYTPKTLPLPRIEAIEHSVQGCVAMLRRLELDPLDDEFPWAQASF